MTARLDTDARRRVMETGQFLMDVLTVGGLDDHGKGRRTIQRVRLMHAAVRHLIKARNELTPGKWHPDWGTPINQEDLAGTVLDFSYVIADPLRRLGVRVPAKDVDAYLHLWNVIGHLMGVRDELLVRGVDDATALVDAIRRRNFAGVARRAGAHPRTDGSDGRADAPAPVRRHDPADDSPPDRQ